MSAKVTIPSDTQAEELVVGATMHRPDRLLDVASELTPEDFYVPTHQQIWDAFLEMYGKQGVRPDPVSLAAKIAERGGDVDASTLVGLMANSYTPSEAHIDSILRTKTARDTLTVCRETLDSLTHGGDPYAAVEDLTKFTRQVGMSIREPRSKTYEEFREQAEGAQPWIIPGIIKKDWKIIVVAGEGVGKAVLLRAMCMATAQGKHFLTHKDIRPARTLLVDLENPDEAIIETGDTILSSLRGFCGERYDPERFRLFQLKEGMNIRKRFDRAALIRELAFQQPELVCIGPLYQMYRRELGEGYEDAADDVIAILNDLRIKFGFALVIEHHAPKKEGGRAKRELAPMGSQRWMAWPEIGLTLEPDTENNPDDLIVGHYRGSRLKEAWPDRIVRSAPWLVSGHWDGGVPDFMR